MADTIHPEGLAAAIFAVTVVFTILCTGVVGLRIWIRITSRGFGAEDWLMCIGTFINTVHNAWIMHGTLTGIGTRDSKLTVAMMIEGYKSVLFWQIFYVSGSVFIKASICTQLLRIAPKKKRYTIPLWTLIVISIVITLIAFSAALARCNPVSASWTGNGTCIDQNIIIVLTYVVSGMNILIDWAVAIIPVFILRNLQMRKALKQAAMLVMGIGALASIATIIRLPYSSAYAASTDVLYHVGNIIIWTVVECSLGIIAGSMPMLRILFRSLARDDSTNPSGTNDINLVTVGQIRGRHHQIYDTDIQVTVLGGEDKDSARDDASTKQIIRVTQTVDQYSIMQQQRNQI